MNSDDIYKIIGYAVVIIFGFYIVSKSLNFQFKIIEGMTRQERKEKEKKEREQEDKDKDDRKKEETTLSKDIDLIIREIHISNNNNIKKFKEYNKEIIYEVVKLFENYITTEKINLFNTFIKQDNKITFSMIIDDLKDACGKISSLTKGINYLSSTSDGDLEEDVKKTEEEEAEEEEAKKKEKGKTKEEKEKEGKEKEKSKEKQTTAEKKEIARLKELNETELEYNNDTVKDISSTTDELKTSYLNLLNAYINEEKISISELMKEISEDTTTYQDNMNEIDIHNINISILQESESILTELFDGGVGRRKKGKKKSTW